jgi:anti-repressor protein
MEELKVIEQNGLIKIYETEAGERVVDARELHEGLESKQDFSDWAKARLSDCDAVDGIDFTIILGKSNGGRPSKEYTLKLETAKEMAILERNEQGKKYRKYLISVEEKYKQVQLDASKLSPQMQLLNQMVTYMAKQELEVKAIQDTANKALATASDIKDSLLQTFDNWREEMARLFNKVQVATGIPFQELRQETYLALETRAKCDLAARVRNLKERLSNEGATKTAVSKVSKLDVIEADARLKEIYSQILKEYAVKYAA